MSIESMMTDLNRGAGILFHRMTGKPLMPARQPIRPVMFDGAISVYRGASLSPEMSGEDH
jgi:hypothetical protein